MEAILIVFVLLFLFGGGGYYWNSTRVGCSPTPSRSSGREIQGEIA